jgi:hypothetical protein
MVASHRQKTLSLLSLSLVLLLALSALSFVSGPAQAASASLYSTSYDSAVKHTVAGSWSETWGDSSQGTFDYSQGTTLTSSNGEYGATHMTRIVLWVDISSISSTQGSKNVSDATFQVAFSAINSETLGAGALYLVGSDGNLSRPATVGVWNGPQAWSAYAWNQGINTGALGSFNGLNAGTATTETYYTIASGAGLANYVSTWINNGSHYVPFLLRIYGDYDNANPNWIHDDFSVYSGSSSMKPTLSLTYTSDAPERTYWSPTFTTSAPTSGMVSTLYHYVPQCNESVTYTLLSKPSWASMTGNDLSGTPSASGLASFSLIATSINGTLATYENWTANITALPVPLIQTTPSVDSTTLTWYDYQPLASIPCNWSVTSNAASWLSINPYTGELSGVPGSSGFYLIQLTATSIQYGTSTTQTYNLTVALGSYPTGGGNTDTGGGTTTTTTDGTSIFGITLTMTGLLVIFVIILFIVALVAIASRRR